MNGTARIHDDAPVHAWQAYRTELVRFVRSRVRDEAVAEDIVHDVLVRAYRQQATLRDGARFESWLYQITRNAITDHYRARRPAGELPADRADDAPDEPNARAELARCVRPLIDRLPAVYREAVLLTEMDGLTQMAAADRLGISHSGMKSRVQRGRTKLRYMLLACCRVEFDSLGAPLDYTPAAGACAGADGGCGGESGCETT